MNIYYLTKNKLISYFRDLTWKKIIVTLIILAFLIIILSQGFLYIEKKKWDNRFGELYYSLNFITYIPNITNIFTPHKYFYLNNLPNYELKVTKENLKKLKKALPENFFGSLPDKSVWVPAKFYSDGKEYAVEIKNRGRMSRHFKYRKKSWHIRFIDEYWQGYQEINLILPEEKEFLVEDYGNYVARKLGLVTPKTWFANLKINNQLSAVYWVNEQWNKNFLERHNLSANANFYREEDKGITMVYEDSTSFRKYTTDSYSSPVDFTDIDILTSCLQKCSAEDFYESAQKIIDLDNFLAWQIHTVILGDDHQNQSTNIRLYFNSVKGKFQFFPVDVSQFKFNGAIDINYNPLVSRLLSLPQIMSQRNKILWEYVNDQEKIKDDLKYYKELQQETRAAFYKDNVKRYSNLYFDYHVEDRYLKAKNQYAYLKNILSSKTKEEQDKQVKIKFYNFQKNIASFDIITDYFSDLELKAVKHQKDDLNNLKLYYDSNKDGQFDNQDLYLSDFVYNKEKKESRAENFSQLIYAQRQIPEKHEELIKILPTKHKFFIVANREIELTNTKFKFNLGNSLTGKKINKDIKFYDYNKFSNLDKIDLTIDEFVQQNPIFKKIGPAEIILFSGNYQISKTVIIPQNLVLTIQPGVQLYLNPKVSIISYSPIIAKGLANNQIAFNFPTRDQGVVAIIDTSQKSEFEYCNFKNGKDANQNGIYFSGMLSSYYADIEIKKCKFVQAQADDALNVKYGKILIKDSIFDSNSADAIDLDFCTGEIINNNFINNKNDAIDISGSQILIINNTINNSGDKGISVGEKSEPLIVNNLILNNKIGIEIKDLSQAIIINNTLNQNEIGVNLYKKKEIFGGGQAEIYNSIIWQNEEQIIFDNDSEIQITNSLIPDGWSGDKNINTDPKFDKDYQAQNLEINKILNLEILKEYDLESYTNLGYAKN